MLGGRYIVETITEVAGEWIDLHSRLEGKTIGMSECRVSRGL